MPSIREVMTPDPVFVDGGRPVRDVTELMRDRQIGDVLVGTAEDLEGVVTDRDIVVRVVAEGISPDSSTAADACTPFPRTVDAASDLDVAAELMRQDAIRRLPVVEGDRVVGVVSLGDLALEADPGSALAAISAAPSDR